MSLGRRTRAASPFPPPLCPRPDRQPEPWRQFRPGDARGDRRRARTISRATSIRGSASTGRSTPSGPRRISRRSRAIPMAPRLRRASPRRGLSRITPLSRQALLLTAMEGFTPEDAGYLIGASRRGGRGAGRRGAGRDRAPDPRRGADHRGRADHRDGHRDDRPRSRPQRHRRRRHPRRGGAAGDGAPAGPGAGRHPARRRQLGHRRGQGHPCTNSRCR